MFICVMIKIQLIQKRSIVQVINMEMFLERSGFERILKKECQIFRVLRLNVSDFV